MSDYILNQNIPRRVKNDDLVIRRREQIIFAAIKLFAKKGFHETNLRELAKEAGIGHGNIYDYVACKQDIFFLIHEYINAVATDKTNQAIKNVNDPLEKLYRMIRAEIDLMYEYSDAVLLIYRESHILDKPRLKELLKNEKTRVEKFEKVLTECITKKVLNEVNTRAAANLIKTMTETMVVKRWDLRGFVSRAEMETTLVNMLFKGMLKDRSSTRRLSEVSETDDLRGKSALIINAGTIWEKELPSFLLSKGVKLALHTNNDLKDEREYLTSQPEKWKEAKVYLSKDVGPMTLKLLKNIVHDFGTIEFIIHDFGVRTNNVMLSKGDEKQSALLGFQENLDCAQELVDYIQGTMNKMSLERILYLAPWAWDRYINSIWYETTKAAIMELSKSMSKRLAASRINVNCVVPGFIGNIGPLKVEEEKYSEVVSGIPLGFTGEASDVLEAIYFLISGKSRYLTGEVLSVSGGKE